VSNVELCQGLMEIFEGVVTDPFYRVVGDVEAFQTY
jgi:hypothetical protein